MRETTVRFEIEDGKGNKILQRDLQSDQYGIAATRFALGRILNEGAFKIRAIVDEQATEKVVTVGQYSLPKFALELALDRPWYRPGDSVEAVVDARYFFGKPVAGGEVTIELGATVAGEQVFDTVVARTDADGRYRAALRLPNVLPGLNINSGNALGFLRVKVKDTAGQAVESEQALTIAASPVSVAVVPESTALVPGVENRLLVFVTDPLGAPLGGSDVEFVHLGQRLPGTTDEFGYLELAFEPSFPEDENEHLVANITVRAPGEAEVEFPLSFDVQPGANHLIVRTDKSVYDLGESLELEVLTSPDSAFVFVDWINAGQVVDMETLEVDEGRATSQRDLDSLLLGSNRISAYVVDEGGDIVRTGKNVFVRNSGSLSISLSTDKVAYEPGETARFTFDVSDENGAPQVAALGVQVVDEAVFGVIDAKPGLLKTYFELADDFARPSYQIKAPGGSLTELIFEASAGADPDETHAAQSRVEANLAALGQPLVVGIQSSSWPQTVSRGNMVLEPYYAAFKERLVQDVNREASSILDELRALGCRPESYYCEALSTTVQEAFRERLSDAIVAVDFWGNAFKSEAPQVGEALRLRSRGPDEVERNTADDGVVAIRYSELQIEPDGSSDAGAIDGDDVFPEDDDVADGDDDTADDEEPSDDDTADDEEPSDEPRVRRDFPETLYVNPAVITGPDGTATLEVELADNITEWRVSSLGHTADGRLGGAVDGVVVFQDFFVDVDFPATLTRGDEVEFPIAVYNYLDEAQNVTLELSSEDWYSPLGATTAGVDLMPGEVAGVGFPVRVERVGRFNLTVTARGSSKSDAVVRNVLVVPDGKAFARAHSGSVASAPVMHEVTIPSESIAGSEEMYVNLFPAFLAQAVQGMDSVLQVPSGCFEQTTSTTWPNVLVTDYMRQTDQITEEILLRAESLISAGYQRLLTFEHPGGGFSWFGTDDPGPFLSVTAFGLMEFSDMAKVHSIDPELIARTRGWLASQQEPDGSWQGDISEFFSFHESQVRNTAFVLWSLATSEYNGPEMARGLDYMRDNLDSNDAYTLAIAANAMLLLGASDASSIVERLEELKQQDGERFFWSTETQTNFYGAGNDAAVTTTALATHALLLDGGHASTVTGALEYITAAKDAQGNFGSTQSTTWSLRALLLAAKSGTEGAEGTLTVSVDDEVFASVVLAAEQRDVMTTLDMQSLALPGTHQVMLHFEGTGKVSYNLVQSHHLPWNNVEEPPLGPLSVAVSYDRQQLQVNETIAATVTVTNNQDRPQNMVLVTVGLPPGFEVDSADLEAYVHAGHLSRYEVTGRQLILYVLELASLGTSTFEYDLRATLPIRAADGGAEVYPYYEPDQRTAAASTLIEVTAAD